MRNYLVACVLTLVAAAPALADPVSCPALAAAVQVAACPSEEELRYTFTGYCSDNARMYEEDENDSCASYENYRRLKNVALWEAADGAFQAYVSCDLPADVVRQLQPMAIAVSARNGLTRLICSYPRNVSFVYRTRLQCRVNADVDCVSDPTRCTAECE